MIGAAAALVTLVLTVPSTNAYVEGDSVFACQGGDSTRDIAWVRFWRQDVTGGMPYTFDSLNVVGKEGQEESLHVDPGPGTHVYTQTINLRGKPSCWSEGVYLPGYVTGVEDTTSYSGSPIAVRWFDVHGRLVQWPPPSSGIYFKKEEWADHRVRVTKRVFLR